MPTKYSRAWPGNEVTLFCLHCFGAYWYWIGFGSGCKCSRETLQGTEHVFADQFVTMPVKWEEYNDDLVMRNFSYKVSRIACITNILVRFWQPVKPLQLVNCHPPHMLQTQRSILNSGDQVMSVSGESLIHHPVLKQFWTIANKTQLAAQVSGGETTRKRSRRRREGMRGPFLAKIGAQTHLPCSHTSFSF